MGLRTATALNRWVKSAEERTLYAGRLNIGPRLIFGFVFIILSMLAADAVILWQFHVVRTQAGRLNDVDQKLVAVLRVHTSLLAFHDRLDVLADAEDADRLLSEAGPLRTAVLEDIRRATSALSLPPSNAQRDPSMLASLHAIQSALPSQIEAVTTLATSRDWRAVHLRLENQVRPLETLTSELVEKVDHEVGEEQVQTALSLSRVQRLVFLIVPLTAFVTLLIAATLGVAITRSITRPLVRLVEGSKALARGEFQHQVSVSGNDELARLGRVFNDTASRLRVLYATLQSSEDRLRLVIDTIPAHAWSAQSDGSVDFINRRFLEFTGRPMEDMLGWGWSSVVHPDDLTRFVSEWQAAVATGKPMESETRVRREDGNYRWLLIRNVPLHDELGNIVNWYGTAIDIEERHRAEDALRLSEAYLAEAQRLSKTGSFGWKPSTGNIIWSEETFRIFQHDRQAKPTVELVLQRVHPEDMALVKQTIERATEDGKDFELEHRLVMADGTVKHVHVVAHAGRDESGEIEFVGALMDVTDRKRAEKELRRSEESLLEAQKLSHTGSWRHDVASGAVTVSPEIYRIHDIKPDDDASNTEFFFTRFHPEDRKRVVDLFERSKVDKTEFEVDYRIVLPDGTIRHLHTTGHPVLNESARLVEFVGTAMDVTAAKQAEEALRRSESYLAEAQRLTHTGSWAWRVEGGDALHFSEEWYRMNGFDPEKGMLTWEERMQRIHPEDRAKWQRAIDRAIDEKSDYEVEVRILLPDGTVKYIHTVGHPVLNASGDAVQFVGSSMDVTASKRAEETLRQSEAYLAEAQRLSHTGSWAWKVGSDRQYWSVETFQIFGFDPNTTEPARENFLGRVHPDDRASIEQVETELYKGNDAEYNYRLILPDGSIKYITSVARPLCKDSGQVIEFVGTVMDVTERKLAETLRDEESRILEMIARDARLEQILEKLALAVEAQFAGLLCSVLLLDEDGQHVRHGAAPSLPTPYTKAIDGLCIGPKAGSCGTAMYRREPVVVTDILQDPLWEAYRDVAEPYGFRACWSTPILSHSGKALGSFAMYYREPGRPSPAETRAQEMATHLAGIAIERKLASEERERLRQARADLARVNRMTTLGELTASLAHEVNQPIAAAVTSANGCLHWLAADVPNLDKARAAAERIVKDGTRAAEIISRIRLLFQKGSLQLELVDVNEIIEEMILLLRGEATRYSISLRTELAADLPQVRGDRVQLQQVMMNLMTNSIDAMKEVDETRELTIKSQRSENEQVLVSFSDSGVGLPPGQADHIFNAFFTTKPHGTGMGLRICRSIVESHGGRLWAADNPPRGANFCLTLPAKSGARA